MTYPSDGARFLAETGKTKRQAILEQVPEEDRNRVGLLANYFMNTQGGRPSDAAHRAVKEYEAGNLERWEASRQAERDQDHRRTCQYGPRVCDRCREIDGASK